MVLLLFIDIATLELHLAMTAEVTPCTKSMQEFDLILRKAFVNGAFICDIGIKNGVISALGVNLIASEETEVIDCEFAVITPGGIDGHVHLAQDSSPRAKEAGYVCADNSEYAPCFGG